MFRPNEAWSTLLEIGGATSAMIGGMTSDDSCPDSPKVGLALPDGELRQRLLSSLEDTSVSVEKLSPGQDIWEEMSGWDVDVIVVRRGELTAEALERLRQGGDDAEAPGVVVMSEGIDKTDRTALMAAGVSRVLSTSDGAEHMAATLETLGEAETVGGQTGPESGGANAQPMLADFLSRSPYMRRFLDLVRKIAPSEASLLVTGETGVGKERLARAIHAHSPRCDHEFVAVNCAALPDALLESELFGHEKGAFTGADSQRIGRFEQARGGTIFLDEVGEMPLHLQVKLLTVLQRHEIQRVGGTQAIPLDVRVMAATNRNVEDEVASGKFREDLYYRLNVISLEVPALRERAEDLPDLVGFLIGHFRESSPGLDVTGITEEALQALIKHPWPGNVRELVNVIERAMLLTNGHEIGLEALPPQIAGKASVTRKAESGLDGPASLEPALPREWRELSIKELRDQAVSWAERQYLTNLLSETGGHIANTAHRAGISPRALYDRLKLYDLDKADFK